MSKILDMMFALAGNHTTNDATATNTPPQFDASKKLTTMEALQRALGNFQAISLVNSNTTLTAAQTGSIIEAVEPGNITITLPAPTTPNLHFRIYNASETNSITLTTPSGVIHRGGNGPASITLASATSMDVHSDGQNWIMTNGWAKGSIGAQNGYQKLPGGLILQWGLSSAIGASSNLAITLPTPFPNGGLVAFANYVNTGGDSSAASQIGQIRGLTATTLTIRNLGSVSNMFYWFALGY